MIVEDQGPPSSAGDLQASVTSRFLWLPVRDVPSHLKLLFSSASFPPTSLQSVQLGQTLLLIIY